MKWQSIETAPKDGTPFIGWLRKPFDSNDSPRWVPWEKINYVLAWWDGTHYEMCFAYEGSCDSYGVSAGIFYHELCDNDLTHWMLPESPGKD